MALKGTEITSSKLVLTTCAHKSKLIKLIVVEKLVMKVGRLIIIIP